MIITCGVIPLVSSFTVSIIMYPNLHTALGIQKHLDKYTSCMCDPRVGNIEPMSQLWLSARFAVALGNALSQTPGSIPIGSVSSGLSVHLALSVLPLAHP